MAAARPQAAARRSMPHPFGVTPASSTRTRQTRQTDWPLTSKYSSGIDAWQTAHETPADAVTAPGSGGGVTVSNWSSASPECSLIGLLGWLLGSAARHYTRPSRDDARHRLRLAARFRVPYEAWKSVRFR